MRSKSELKATKEEIEKKKKKEANYNNHEI